MANISDLASGRRGLRPARIGLALLLTTTIVRTTVAEELYPAPPKLVLVHATEHWLVWSPALGMEFSKFLKDPHFFLQRQGNPKRFRVRLPIDESGGPVGIVAAVLDDKTLLTTNLRRDRIGYAGAAVASYETPKVKGTTLVLLDAFEGGALFRNADRVWFVPIVKRKLLYSEARPLPLAVAKALIKSFMRYGQEVATSAGIYDLKTDTTVRLGRALDRIAAFDGEHATDGQVVANRGEGGATLTRHHDFVFARCGRGYFLVRKAGILTVYSVRLDGRSVAPRAILQVTCDSKPRTERKGNSLLVVWGQGKGLFLFWGSVGISYRDLLQGKWQHLRWPQKK